MIHVLEGCGDDADRADGGDEIGVTRPTGDDVDMEVLRDAGTGGLAFIDADVPALWVEGAIHESAAQVDELPEGRSLRGVVIIEGRPGFAERHQQVSVAVGVAIQQDDAGLIAMNDEVFGIVLRLLPILPQEGGRGGRVKLGWFVGG